MGCTVRSVSVWRVRGVRSEFQWPWRNGELHDSAALSRWRWVPWLQGEPGSARSGLRTATSVMARHGSCGSGAGKLGRGGEVQGSWAAGG